MNIILPVTFRTCTYRFVAALGFLIIASSAHAVFIDFDDIDYIPVDPESPQFYDVPLYDQYADKGLIIDGAFLMPYTYVDPAAIKSRPNWLLGSNFVTLSFTGDLPTFVGMYVSSFWEEPMYLNAYNSTGLIGSKATKGHGGSVDGEPTYKYTHKQYIGFSNDAGISSVTMEGYYNMRVSGMIDDLTFTRKVPAPVPEPSALLLLALGVFGLFARKMRLQ